MRTEQGRTIEEDNLGVVPRIIEETDTTVLVGVPVSKEWLDENLPFIASLIEAARRLIRKQ